MELRLNISNEIEEMQRPPIHGLTSEEGLEKTQRRSEAVGEEAHESLSQTRLIQKLGP